MTIIQIGCSQKGLPNWVQQIVTGGIIVAAVALDRRAIATCHACSTENRLTHEDSRPRDPRPSLSDVAHATPAPTRCIPIPTTRPPTSSSRPTAASRATASRSRSAAATKSASRRFARSVSSSSAGRSRTSPSDLAGFWRSLASRVAAALARAREGRHPPRDGGHRQRRLGSARQARAEAGVEAARRHDAAADRRLHRLPLHHRRADAGRGARAARAAGSTTKAQREAELLRDGYPAYTTSAGWMGYSDDDDAPPVPRGARRRLDALQGEGRRRAGGRSRAACALVREEIGPISTADDRRQPALGRRTRRSSACARWRDFNLWWIEEPTSPDDVLGHATIASGRAAGSASRPASTAPTAIIFKQLLQAEAIDFCQIDSCRLGGVNENLAVILMAAKFGVPVCPHAGGVGLCELRAAPVDVRLHRGLGTHGRPRHRIRRSPARALRRSRSSFARGRYLAPTQPGYSITIKTRVARRLPLSRWPDVARRLGDRQLRSRPR